MGYTHYWHSTPYTAELSSARWSSFTRAVEQLVEIVKRDYDFTLVEEEDLPGSSPIVTDDEVRFNGLGGAGYETFVLSRRFGEFEFCKTARRPYDTAVTAVLCLAALHLGPAIRVTSDGDRGEWADGLALARRVDCRVRVPAGV